MPTERYLHANFKLKNTDGALVLLSASDYSWQDTLIYQAHSGRETVGRFPNGGRQLYRSSHPTIEKGNALNSYSVPIDYDNWIDGIAEINNEELIMKNEESAGAVYDLGGRKIKSQFSTLHSQLKKGLYIINGKKIANR